MKPLICLLFLLPLGSYAQDKRMADSLKFEILKTTVEFLSRDHLDEDSAFTGEDSAKLMQWEFGRGNIEESLKKYCDTAKVNGGGTKIERWMDLSYETVEQRKQSINDILNAVAGGNRSYRTKFKSFPGFVADLEKLAAIERTPEANQTEGNTSSAIPGGGDSTNIRRDLAPPGQSTPFSVLLPSILALLTSIGGFIYLLSRLNAVNKQLDRREASNNRRKEEIKDLQSRVRSLDAFQLSFGEYKNRVELLERSVSALSAKMDAAANKKAEVRELNPANLPKSKGPLLLYAKLPDLNGGKGFSQDMIKTEQNGEQIFELAISNDSGTFLVSNNSSAQDYALDNPNYNLSPGCIFLNNPQKGCRITTKEHGKLMKSGSNWIITEKAQIEFVGGWE
jgi:hypothetical protein